MLKLAGEIKNRYNEQTIEVLEYLLAQAKEGEFISFIGTVSTKGGEFIHFSSGCDNLFEVIGVLERQKYSCLERMRTEGVNELEDDE